ncbi:unnamed protein product [Linum trigynum]|uniref:Uncharacterized protein n=1 Tax=Linum trigynum TaxID=586398 RepID=A0AAV2CLI6_9ROSI
MTRLYINPARHQGLQGPTSYQDGTSGPQCDMSEYQDDGDEDPEVIEATSQQRLQGQLHLMIINSINKN